MAESILLVEDDDDHALLILRALKRLGRTATRLPSAEAALQHLDEHAPPALMLLDLKLPGQSGHELLHTLRGPEHNARFPIVVLSTSGTLADRENALLEGASGYEVKTGALKALTDNLGRVTRRWLSASGAIRLLVVAPDDLDSAHATRLDEAIRAPGTPIARFRRGNADVALVLGSAQTLPEQLRRLPDHLPRVAVCLKDPSDGVTSPPPVLDHGIPVLLPDELRGSWVRRAIRAAQARHGLVRRLERQNAELERFAAMAAHDLKAPVRHLAGIADLLRMELADPPPSPEIAELLQLLEERSKRAGEMVDELLRFARYSVPPTQECDLDGALDTALEDLQELVRDVDPVIRRAPLPTVKGSPEQLARVFQNLLGNALRYRDPERRLLIEISARPGHDGGTTVLVSDNGVGIADEDVGQIFKPHVRRNRAAEGTGLGLSIVQRVIDTHGGRVRVASEVGVGSTFMLDFPSSA